MPDHLVLLVVGHVAARGQAETGLEEPRVEARRPGQKRDAVGTRVALSPYRKGKRRKTVFPISSRSKQIVRLD